MPRSRTGRALVSSSTRRLVSMLRRHEATHAIALLRWRLSEIGRATSRVGDPVYLGLSIGPFGPTLAPAGGALPPFCSPKTRPDANTGGLPTTWMTAGDVHAVSPRHTAGADSSEQRPRFSGYAVGGDTSVPPETETALPADHMQIWQIVELAQNGSAEAFGLLYDRYADMVFRFIYYRVHDRQLAEDFTSETFLRALRRITGVTYQGRDIGAWFMTIARNIVLDHVKSARNRFEFTTGDVIEDGRAEPSTETAVLAMLSNERLIAAVNTLNEEQRECVVLRFIQGLSVAETAEVMGKKEGAIKALQHRAVKKLAVDIKDELR